jgi:hypothetical protein
MSGSGCDELLGYLFVHVQDRDFHGKKNKQAFGHHHSHACWASRTVAHVICPGGSNSAPQDGDVGITHRACAQYDDHEAQGDWRERHQDFLLIVRVWCMGFSVHIIKASYSRKTCGHARFHDDGGRLNHFNLEEVLFTLQLFSLILVHVPKIPQLPLQSEDFRLECGQQRSINHFFLRQKMAQRLILAFWKHMRMEDRSRAMTRCMVREMKMHCGYYTAAVAHVCTTCTCCPKA